MKKILYSFALLAGSVLFPACDKYIDIQPLGQVTIDSTTTYYELIANPLICYYPSSFALLTDELWPKETNIIGHETSSIDGVNFTFNEKVERDLFSDNNLYENIYSYILRYNLVLTNIDEAPGDQSIVPLAKAEARTLRAWNHFLAVNIFAKAYDPATAQNDAGVCIVQQYDLEATPSRSTVAEVYDFLISELEESVPQLDKEPVSIYHPSQAYGWALLAQVYLHHRDWANAEQAARKSLALNSQLADLTQFKSQRAFIRQTDPVYADAKNPEVLSYMWLSGGWTQDAATLYNYGTISPELVKLFEPGDNRFNLFFTKDASVLPSFWDCTSGAAIWVPTITSAKYTYITTGTRTPEVYLILAEALARQGHPDQATQELNLLRAKRLTSDSALPEATTEAEAMQQVILERRKELLFGFHRFFDLKRLNVDPEYATTVTHTFPIVSTSQPQQTYTLQPGSPLYVIPIPKSATDKNPNL